MGELVYLKNNKTVTTSLMVAEYFHKNHAHVLRDIENLDCSDDFRESNFGLSSYQSEQNKKLPMYLITKDGFVFLVMGYRGKRAAEIKEKYIHAFNEMEKILTEKNTQAWIETRQQGKLTRKAETDVIKELVEYAKEQGSTHSDMLYITYSKLANTLAGIKSRDHATVMQLNNLSIFENIILQMIRSGIDKGLNYKEIYKECKLRCSDAKEIAMIG